MSANDAKAVGELEEPPVEDNGIDYGAYSATTETPNDASDSISFSSKDISKREKAKFFVNVEGAEKRAKKAEKERLKKERQSRKAMLKEASKTKKAEIAERNAAEAKKNREVKRIRDKYRLEKFRGFVWRYKAIIIISASVIAIAVLAIIFVPMVISNINQAQEEAFINENKTDMMKIFEMVAGKKYEKSEFETTVKKINDKIQTEYFEDEGEISLEGTGDTIEFSMIDMNGATIIGSFGFRGVVNGTRMAIMQDGNEYVYYENGEKRSSGTAEELLKEVINQRGGKK